MAGKISFVQLALSALCNNGVVLRKKNILITGAPGVGKTTLIKKVFQELKDLHPAGFFTSEIRKKGVREGFELESLDGRTAVLSHTGIKSPYRIGKYGVDVKGFEEFLGEIPFFDLETGLIVIDEIGKMECMSEKFTELVERILDSGKPVMATIGLKGAGPVTEIKKRDDVRLFEVSTGNRDSLLTEILAYLRVPHSRQ